MNPTLELSAPIVKETFAPRAVVAAEMRVKTRIIDARTGRVVKESPWRKNLINDAGLNRLAGTAPATTGAGHLFDYCKIGSGSNANKIGSGAITFTQSGTTLTASGGFFTAAMAGALFKWGSGSGGTEVYISSYTSATQVTLATSATVSTPTVGTVWMVQETSLQTYLYRSNTYQTNAGDCGTTLSGATLTMQRTFNFAIQASPYSVNEIGYQQNASASNDGVVNGRIVLASTDTVATTNYYQVIMALALTYSPATPTAVSDVGTNINTAGTLAIEWLPLYVDSSGNNITHWITGVSSASYSGYGYLRLATATYSQNANPSNTSTLNPAGLSGASAIPAAARTANRGEMEWTVTVSVGTTAQTMYGFGFGGFSTSPFHLVWDVKLTTPYVLPTGTFQATVKFKLVYDRTLSN